MSKIERFNGNLEAFGSAAIGTERTLFGETTQADDLTSQVNDDYKRGWGIVGVNDAPTKQDFNALGFTATQLAAYLHQVGVPEWNGSQEYHIDSFVNYEGKLYRCKTADLVSITAPDNDATNWALGGGDDFLPKVNPSYTGTLTGSGDAVIHGATVGRGAGANVSNTAMGSGALSSNTTGSFNTAVGRIALRDNTTGNDNTANGVNALRDNTTGSFNTANGVNALLSNTTGSNNIGNGSNALLSNTTGSNNIGNGSSALFDTTTGNNNIGIGFNAGRSSSPRTITTQSNEICIGNNAHTSAFIRIAFTVTSDARDKAALAPIPHGLDFVNALLPTEYQFKAGGRDGVADGKRRYGFLAQNVLAAEGKNPVIINNDDPDSLKMTSDYLIPILVNAMKELTEQVKTLKAEVATLKGK